MQTNDKRKWLETNYPNMQFEYGKISNAYICYIKINKRVLLYRKDSTKDAARSKAVNDAYEKLYSGNEVARSNTIADYDSLIKAKYGNVEYKYSSYVKEIICHVQIKDKLYEGRGYSITAAKKDVQNKIINQNYVIKSKVEDVKQVDENKMVHIYKSINNTCYRKHGDNVIQKKLDFYNPQTGDNVEVDGGFYCNFCKKSFITIEVINRYTQKLYIPNFKYGFASDFGEELKYATPLTLYGYTVKKGVLSTRQRRNIIDFVIKYQIMPAHKIVESLQFNIRMREKNPKMQNACEKWYDDIRYIQGVDK